ncbi:MAX dimerization protein MGA a [Chanos chanos]|uniref:MAX dimerization protein MGA a n=1 Tax=Chanos chanos TaxID=29144 RepID=A0A6J2WJC3_CHACN|nr:MAX gene-associated protein-like [Chanos chanos]
MAATEEQAVMVLHEEGVAASALAPSTASAPTLFVVLKPGQPSDGGQDQQGANTVVKSAQGSTVASSCAISSMLPAAMANTSCSNQQGNLSPEATCKGITVTLDNNSMWNEFYRCKTEMILTKQGRRMFPYCRFRISGMEPFQRYVLAMDVTPADNHRYRWSERRWEPGGKAEPHISGRSFIHPESPSLGHYWMQNPVSFYKLKLTNNTMDQEGHIILHSMHRYLPRLHVIPAEKETDIIQLNAPDVMTFTFPQTEFFAVTAYQNLSITQLKINYNPFAKGFREDAANTRILKADNGSSSEALEKEVKLSKEANTLKNLKSLFAKKNVVEKAVKDQKPSTVNGDTGAVNVPDLTSGPFTLNNGPTPDLIHGPSTPNASVTTTPPCTSNPVKASNTITDFQHKTESAHEPCSDPSVEIYHEENKLSQDDAPSSPSHAPCSPAFSLLSATPSSPDPEPQSPGPDEGGFSGALQPTESAEGSGAAAVSMPSSTVYQASVQPVVGIKNQKCKSKHRKGGKMTQNDDEEVTEGPVPVPLQPSLEDVEGQLFVSFMSKEALQIHLGNYASNEETAVHLQTTPETTDKMGGVVENIEERIAALEKSLLNDLKLMRHRQVIHPVLQEVGLKLNLLDLILEIDLRYLGVRLPLPPPVRCPGGSLSSSNVRFVSRTGKTTDFTKIKGWRDKFVPSDLTSSEGSTSSDRTQKNLSAFCSDMLDEYLASEGKLIDERAASFSQAAATPVTYQLPTKSTSYVRTLDSVLKKQALSPTSVATSAFSRPFSPPKRSTQRLGPQDSCKSLGNKLAKFSTLAHALSSEPSTVTSDSRKSTLKNKTGLSTTEKSSASSENRELGKSKSKKNGKTKMRPKTLQGHGHLGSGLTSEDGAEESKTGNTRSSAEGGHSSGLPKTLVKLMDVEDGAVWEGKPRTYITEERAAIALSSLITGEGTLNVNPAALRIIKRRAPPCLNDFCRLGCVCASLAQERRHHHCGKPECMLGCGCLRRKVVLLKSSVKEEDVSGEEKTSSAAAEEGESEPKKKKKKKRKAYVLSDPETVPEPALHVKTLWNKKEIAPDPEPIFMPPPVIYPSSPSLDTDQNFESCSPLTPLKKSRMENLDDAESSMTCARTRPISFKKTPSSSIQGIGKENEHCGTLARTMQENQTQKLQEADLLSLAASKRLEIVSNCKWKGTGIRNYVLRVVCERMAQDRLKSPFWVGKYYVQPISQTPLPDEEGSTVTYKVRISQPGLSQNRVQRKEMPADVRNKADLISMIGKRAEKGLPLLSKVAPAGLLIANKKQPGSSAQGLITVNGKQYPQAKLELSQMGALHPANRLAAYITGKAWPTTQSGTKVEKVGTTVSPTKAPPSVTPTTSASKATSVTSTSACAIISVTKPMVTKPTTGKVLSQVVVNQFLSEQQKLPSTSAPQIVESVQKIILPSPSPMATPNIQVATTKPLSTPGTTDGTTSHLKSVPGSPSGLDTLERGKSFVMVPVSVQPTVPTGGPTLPTRPKRPILPQGQKLPLRLVRTSPLGTLFRGPNGQLVRLIPLSQVKSLKANNPVTSSNTVTHFPTPVAPRSAAIRPHITTTATRSVAVPLKRSPGGTATIMSPAVPASSAIQAQSQTPVHSSPSNVTPTPSVTTQSVSPASGQDQVKVTFSNFLSPPKSQGSLGDSGLDAMKVVPQKSCQEPGIIKTTTAKGETPKSHGADPVTDAFMCSSSSSSSLTQGGDQESERAAVCALAGGSVSDLKPSQESETPSGETAPAEVILGDHSYIGGQSNQDTSDDISSAAHPLQIDNSTSSVCESKQLSDPGKVAHETAVSPKGEGGAAALSSNSGSCSLEKEDLDLKVVSDEEAAERAEASEVTPDGKDNEKYADREEGEISSDIMGDSDEYTEDSEDSEDDSDDDIHSVCDSDDGEKSKDNEVTDSVDEDTVDFLDKEDEDAVDVETVEELPEEMRVAPLRTLTSHSEFTTVQHAGRSHEKRALHKRIERMRRYELKERFQNLQRVLGCDLEKTTKYLTLNQARLEISTLLAQTESLKEERKVQEQQQEAYLKRISELSGKSEDSVLLNIQGICKREKSLEIQDQETGEGVAAPSPPTSASHMLIKGEPDMKPPVGRNSGNAHPGREQGEIDSDVTEDSVDLFEESEDSDDDSALVICDSDQEKSKNEGKTCFVFPDIVELTDSEEDEEDLEKSIYHRKTDKMRRDDLNGRFQNLQHAIGRHDQATKYHTLNKARLEISTLLTQSKNLTEQRRALEHQQVAYLKRISELSGKSVEKQKSPAKLSDALSTCKQTPSVQSPAPSNASSPSPGNSQRPTLNLPSHRTLDSAPNSDSSPAPQISPRNTKAPAPNTSPNRTPDTVVQHLAKRPSFGSVFNYSVQRERTRPNILSRPRSKPGPPAPKAPPIIPVLNAVLPCNQILTISNPLQPIGITEIRGQPTTPGVASVTFAVPAIPHQVLVTNPVPEPQTLKVISGHAVEVNSSDKGIVPPKITSVISVMPPAEKLLVLDKMEVLTPVSVPVHVPVPVLMPRAEQTSKNSPVLERGRVEGDKLAGSSGLKQTLESIVLKASEAAPSRRGEAERKEGKDDGRDPEDETLIDLLNELIFLNQQLNTESSEPTEGTSNLAEIGGVAMGMASEPPAGADKEDDRSLSPLFLRLDEELTTTPTAKDDDAPPVVDDLVKVVFGSEPLPTPGSGVSMATNGHGQHSPTVSVNGETLTPPPLQQMKAGSAATSTDSTDKPKEEAKVSWRPMPKLAPLGLKAVVQAQDATLSINKTPPLKPRNTLPTVNNPQET